MDAGPVVGRLAPSPTGYLHLGHARSFLLAYWSVRRQGGRLLLRIEDLDTQRSREDFVDATLRDLEWLGVTWDGSARRQSIGAPRIREVAYDLLARGRAYPCTCSRADLTAAANAPQAGASEQRYAGRCRGRYTSLKLADAATQHGAAVRYHVASGTVSVEDAFLGHCSFDVSADCGDFVILRRDKSPSYQLAVVVDDAADGVTEVVRGDDLLPSAARQQLLQKDLSLGTPRWFHVPLVVDAEGRRFAKRTDDLSLRSLRNRGVSPETIVGWVARESGMPQVDRATAEQLVACFDWSQVPPHPVMVTRETLRLLLR